VTGNQKMFSLNDKRALITGASGGIGAAIAKALHAQGATVGLSGTREDALAKLAAEIGSRTHVLPCNLSDAAAVAELLPRAEAAMGGIDILVNNAGLNRDTLMLRMKDEDWQAVIDIDLTAAFKLSRAALKGMVKRRFGRIIQITSIVGAIGNAGQANYAAAKAGLVGMTKALAQEMGTRGITANCIAPGYIDTAMTSALNEEQRAKLATKIPLERFGTPADVAAAVVFLASDEASYVTGQTLHVNGGMVML
jgi:3-oxoacyl-[acyl-carrier protein] reductase